MPVSYTHLDVYKRQASINVSTETTESFSHASRAERLIPMIVLEFLHLKPLFARFRHFIMGFLFSSFLRGVRFIGSFLK